MAKSPYEVIWSNSLSERGEIREVLYDGESGVKFFDTFYAFEGDSGQTTAWIINNFLFTSGSRAKTLVLSPENYLSFNGTSMLKLNDSSAEYVAYPLWLSGVSGTVKTHSQSSDVLYVAFELLNGKHRIVAIDVNCTGKIVAEVSFAVKSIAASLDNKTLLVSSGTDIYKIG